MRLKDPFFISSRLMAGIKVAAATLSLEISGMTSRDGRDIYTVWIDLPDGTEHEVTDLRSGCQGGSVREGFSALFSFLSAAVESYNYRQRTGRAGENEDLFSPAIVEFFANYADELSMMDCYLEEDPDLISEED